jgi:anti-sigma B factor antagonist
METTEIPKLQMETERQATTTVVHCTGEVAVGTLAEFSECIRALFADGKPIRVDLANITRVDSTGVGAFVAVWAAAKRRNCDLKYTNPNAGIEDVIRVSALLGMLEGHEAEEQQLNAAFSRR